MPQLHQRNLKLKARCCLEVLKPLLVQHQSLALVTQRLGTQHLTITIMKVGLETKCPHLEAPLVQVVQLLHLLAVALQAQQLVQLDFPLEQIQMMNL